MLSISVKYLSRSSSLIPSKRTLIIIPRQLFKKQTKTVVVFKNSQRAICTSTIADAAVNYGTSVIMGAFVFVKWSVVFGVVGGTLDFIYEYWSETIPPKICECCST